MIGMQRKCYLLFRSNILPEKRNILPESLRNLNRLWAAASPAPTSYAYVCSLSLQGDTKLSQVKLLGSLAGLTRKVRCGMQVSNFM